MSRICAEIYEAVAEFLHRRIDHTWFRYLFLDAAYFDVPLRGSVVSQALVVATGVSGEGRREILGMSVGDAETTDFWSEFLRSLRERGLKVITDADPLGVALVTSDTLAGLRTAVKAIPARRRPATLPRPLRAQRHPAVEICPPEARERADHRDLRPDHRRGRDRSRQGRHRQPARLVPRDRRDAPDRRGALDRLRTMPREDCQKIWSNNPIERFNRESKRRADVGQIFPDRESVTSLVGAVLQEQHEEWHDGERRYVSEISIRKLSHTLHDHTGPARLELTSPPDPTITGSNRSDTTPQDLTCPSPMEMNSDLRGSAGSWTDGRFGTRARPRGDDLRADARLGVRFYTALGLGTGLPAPPPTDVAVADLCGRNSVSRSRRHT